MRSAWNSLSWVGAWALLATLACAPLPRPGAAQLPAASGLELPELATEPSAPSHVVMVSVAGMTPRAYLATAGEAPGMPAVASLAKRGVAAEQVEAVAPAATYPAHTTLVTGHRPARHGVAADLLLGDRGVRRVGYWHATHVRTPSLWQLATESRRRAAALGWPATAGANIEYLLPEILPTRPGETLPRLMADTTTPWLQELAIRFGAEQPEASYPGPVRDAMLVGIACEVMRSPAPPALLLLRLSQTEPVLRDHGPGSTRAREAFGRADAEVARVARCLADAGLLARSALVIVGDHGTLPVHTAVRPNFTLLEGGLIERGDEGTVRQWLAVSRSNGGSAFVYARAAEDALRARSFLEAAAEESRAFRVVSADEMLRLGADPEAWFGLEAELGYVFADSMDGPLLGATQVRGAGGYLPATEAMRPGFAAWGPGLRQGLRVPRMRQTDVAPTVAALLGLDLGAVEGRTLVGLLRMPPSRGPLPASPAEPAAPEKTGGY